MSRPRVLLADDHTLLLEAFRRLLAAECEVVGAVADGQAVLEAVPKLRPDVVVLDISMPLMNGLEVGRRLRKLAPEVKLIYLTVSEDPSVCAEALRLGASGYLLKSSAATELFEAIRAAVAGETYVTPRAAGGALETSGAAGTKAAATGLTPRQREILKLTIEGCAMKEIATRLQITPRTVAFHKYRMMRELGVRSTAELIRFALRAGLP